jgi:ElaB/YqjD/DUF883 family membrane-anchored ribosome-binding protein
MNHAEKPVTMHESSSSPSAEEAEGFRIHKSKSNVSRSEHRARRREQAMALVETPRAQLAAIGRKIEAQYRRRPYSTLAIALGIGFALGGGLSSRAGRIALAAVGRYLVKELVKVGV